MKDLKQSLASVTDAIGISDNGDKPLWDARGYPGASAQFVLSRGQLGFCAGALFGSIAVPMTAYGARSQHHVAPKEERWRRVRGIVGAVEGIDAVARLVAALSGEETVHMLLEAIALTILELRDLLRERSV